MLAVLVLLLLFVSNIDEIKTSSLRRRLRSNNPHFVDHHVVPLDSHFVQFMGKTTTKNVWKSINMHIDNLLTYGNWVDAWTVENYRPVYDRFCFWEHPFLMKYVFNDCAKSLGVLGYKYLWRPSLKKLSLFSPETMCQLMHGRNVMFAGDSMQEELFYILISAMLAHVRIPHQYAFNESYILEKRNQSATTCDSFCPYGIEQCEGPVTIDCGVLPQFNISFYRTDHLLATNQTDNTTATWIERITDHNISLLILNTGAHFIAPMKSVHHVLASLRMIYARHEGISIIYRSTPFGHPNCTEHFASPPWNNDDPVWRENMTMSSIHAMGHEEYHWHHFPIQNQLMHTYLTQEFPQLLWLNLHTSIQLRPDSHPLYKQDCLHYCSGSGLDEWITFLMNALMIVEDQTASSNSSREEDGREEDEEVEQKTVQNSSSISSSSSSSSSSSNSSSSSSKSNMNGFYYSAKKVEEKKKEGTQSKTEAEKKTTMVKKKQYQKKQQLQDDRKWIGEEVLWDDEVTRSAFWRQYSFNVTADKIEKTHIPHIPHTSYAHIDRHANAYVSSLHVSLVTWASEFSRVDSRRIVAIHGERGYVFLNGTRRFLPDSWTYSIYHDDLAIPLLRGMSVWDIIQTPLRPPILPQPENFTFENLLL